METALVENATRASRADVRRRHVIETARALFIEHGFHRTGVAQIAAASGIKVGQIYRDFQSKEDVIAAICEEGVAEWIEEDVLVAAVAEGDLPAIRCWIKRFGSVDDTAEKCRMMTEILAEAGRNERVAAILRTIDARIRKNLSAALAALVPAKERTDRCATLIDFILAQGFGVMARMVVHPDMKTEPLGHYITAVIEREIDELSR